MICDLGRNVFVYARKLIKIEITLLHWGNLNVLAITDLRLLQLYCCNCRMFIGGLIKNVENSLETGSTEGYSCPDYCTFAPINILMQPCISLFIFCSCMRIKFTVQ